MRLVVVYPMTNVAISILAMVRDIIVSDKGLWQLRCWRQDMLHYQRVVQGVTQDIKIIVTSWSLIININLWSWLRN